MTSLLSFRQRETRLLKTVFAGISEKQQTVTANTLSTLLDRFAEISAPDADRK
ncbi:MAG: hypothetical protein AAFX56_06975 [Pseudomonadota bacterium]